MKISQKVAELLTQNDDGRTDRGTDGMTSLTEPLLEATNHFLYMTGVIALSEVKEFAHPKRYILL